MDVAASVDRLISSLQSFKIATSNLERGRDATEFEALFTDASSKLKQLAMGSTVTPELEAAGIMVAANPKGATFEHFQTQNLLVDSQRETTASRPNMREFMDATGASASDASELLYGVIGSNGDLRDWSKIMASGNPMDATRAATGQLYNSDKDYALVNHQDFGTLRYNKTLAESSLTSKTVLSKSGNFAEIETDALSTALVAVSSNGLILRDAGATQQQIQHTAWLLGFDVPKIYAQGA